MNASPILCFGQPLPPEAVKLLEANGFMPSDPPPVPSPPTDANASNKLTPLTKTEALIWRALTDRPMNDSQIALLELHWRARRDGEPPMSVDEAARRLAQGGDVAYAGKAADYARGAMRSFGRRLTSALEKKPVKDDGDASVDGFPFQLLFAIDSGPRGEVRHRLTDAGYRAVAAALGMPACGHSAAGVQTGDVALDDPNEAVEFGMSKLSAALIMRVQRSLGVPIDEAIRVMTTRMGAG